MKNNLLTFFLFVVCLAFHTSVFSQEDEGGREAITQEHFNEVGVAKTTEVEETAESAPLKEVQPAETPQPVNVQQEAVQPVVEKAESSPVKEVQPAETPQPANVQEEAVQPVENATLNTQPVKTQSVETTPVVTPQTTNTDSLDAARIGYVERINSFRSTIGLPALERWTDGEACADNSAKIDATSGDAHKSMGSCGEFAQNSCPKFDSIAIGNSLCLQMMWNEGPPPSEPCTGACYAAHGHYINMTKKDYTKVAVGFYQMPDGKVWVNMNFK